MRTSSSSGRSRLSTGALFLISIIAAFTTAEVGARVYGRFFACHREKPSPQGLYRRDERYGHTLTPGYVGSLDGGCWSTPVRVSSAGTRGGEIPDGAPGRRRIVAIGDSYTFGLGVGESETMTAALERELNVGRQPGGNGDVEIINAGVPGWTTIQATLLLEDRTLSLGADEALIVIYLGNDVEERVRFEEHSPKEAADAGRSAAGSQLEGTGGADLRGGSPPGVHGAPVAGGWPTSHLFGILSERWMEASFRSGVRKRPFERPWFEIFLGDVPPRVRRGFDLIAGDLARASTFARATGLQLRAVVIPFWVQVTRPTAADLCGAFRCPEGSIDMRRPNAEIAAALSRAGIPALDLTDDLASAFKDRRYRFVVGHWDAAGCAIAAERIASWIRKATAAKP